MCIYGLSSTCVCLLFDLSASFLAYAAFISHIAWSQAQVSTMGMPLMFGWPFSEDFVYFCESKVKMKCPLPI